MGEGDEAGGDNPFLKACSDMFKEYEKVTKDGTSSAAGGSTGMPGVGDDDLAKLLSSLTGDMLSGDPSKSDGAMDNIMNSLQAFMQENGNDEEVKNALEEVVGELISKDTL